MTAFGLQLIKLPACPCYPLHRPGLARSRLSSGSCNRGNCCQIRAESGESSGDNKDSKDESAEKLFQKELQRRGISGTERNQRSSSRTSTTQTEPPPFNKEKFRSQLERSRQLNSEGLEGLVPRAKQLLALGLTFFLAFGPVILAISLLFSGIFWLYGENFIHGGRPGFTRYVDPAELLNEPTVDERIPFY